MLSSAAQLTHLTNQAPESLRTRTQAVVHFPHHEAQPQAKVMNSDAQKQRTRRAPGFYPIRSRCVRWNSLRLRLCFAVCCM